MIHLKQPAEPNYREELPCPQQPRLAALIKNNTVGWKDCFKMCFGLGGAHTSGQVPDSGWLLILERCIQKIQSKQGLHPTPRRKEELPSPAKHWKLQLSDVCVGVDF